MQIIDGRKLAQEKYSKLTGISSRKLCVVLASNDIASKTYVSLKLKRAQELGFEFELKEFEESTTTQDVVSLIQRWNLDISCNGILVQLPLYKHLDELAIINAVAASKDVDGLTSVQQGRVSQLAANSLPPAAVLATLDSISYAVQQNVSWKDLTANSWNISDNYYSGKIITIVNNSNLIGIPLSTIFSKCGATVHICNEYTKDIKKYTLESDIVITATGKTRLFDHTFFKTGAVVIDITSEKVGDAFLGDVINSKELEEKISALTPVPGGIGPLTIACLLENLAQN